MTWLCLKVADKVLPIKHADTLLLDQWTKIIPTDHLVIPNGIAQSGTFIPRRGLSAGQAVHYPRSCVTILLMAVIRTSRQFALKSRRRLPISHVTPFTFPVSLLKKVKAFSLKRRRTTIQAKYDGKWHKTAQEYQRIPDSNGRLYTRCFAIYI